MAELKTKETEASVEAFLASVENDRRREDARAVTALMQNVTGLRPKMWGPSIIGFGQYHYKYDSGHEGDMCMIGLSPRKQNLVLYIMPGFKGQEAMLKRLGKHKTGKSCLYLNKLAEVDQDVLEAMIREAFDFMRQRYES